MGADRLFELAFQYKKTGLWNDIYEDQMFAVRLADDRIGYVSIMGFLGEHVAVALYIGEEGLRSYHTLRDDKFQHLDDTDYNPVILNNDSLQAVFDSKDFLDKEELAEARAYAKQHGIRIAGKNAFPHFLKLSPGFVPCKDTSDADVNDLIVALEAAIAVARGPIVNEFDFRDFERIGRESAKIPLIEAGDSVCSMEMIDLPHVEEYRPAEGLTFDKSLAERLSKLPKEHTLQAGLMILPAAVGWEGSDIPVIPTYLCVVDKTAENAIAVQPVACYEQRTNVMLDKFMEALEDAGFIPKSIVVDDEYTAALLRAWCAYMKIPMVVSGNRLTELSECKSGLYDHMVMPEDEGEITEMEQMLDELLACKPEEIASMYDVFYEPFRMLVDAMSCEAAIPLSMQRKIANLISMFEAARDSGMVDYFREISSAPDNRKPGGKAPKRKSASDKKPPRKKGSAVKSNGKGKKEPNAVVISVSLGTGCYRHIRFNDTDTLDQLSDYILEAFEFVNDHAHAFFMDNRSWSQEDCYYISGIDSFYKSTDKTPLHNTDMYVGKKFKYIFDFGDEWTFQCKILRIEPEPAEYPEVIRSKGSAPSQYGYRGDDWDDDWDDDLE